KRTRQRQEARMVTAQGRPGAAGGGCKVPGAGCKMQPGADGRRSRGLRKAGPARRMGNGPGAARGLPMTGGAPAVRRRRRMFTNSLEIAAPLLVPLVAWFVLLGWSLFRGAPAGADPEGEGLRLSFRREAVLFTALMAGLCGVAAGLALVVG